MSVQGQSLQQPSQHFAGVRADRDGLTRTDAAAGSAVRRRVVHFDTAAQLHMTRQQFQHARRYGRGSRRQV